MKYLTVMKAIRNFSLKNNTSAMNNIERLNDFEMFNIRGGSTTGTTTDTKTKTKEMDVYDTRED